MAEHNTPTAYSSQRAVFVDPEKLMEGLSPVCSLEGETLGEPFEPINKARAVIHMLMGCQDVETGGFLINPQDLDWGLILISDLLIDAETRADRLQDHCQALYREFEKRLATYSLAGRNPGKTTTKLAGQEV